MKKRTKRMKPRRFFLVGTVLTCLILMLFGMYTLVGAMMFGSSKPTLQELAEPYFAEAAQYQHVGTPQTEFQEKNPYWFAMQYPQTGQPAIDLQIANLKTQITDDFVKQYESMAAQQAQSQTKDESAHTMFLRYESYQTEDGKLSVVFQDAYYSNDSPSVFSHWHPYLLDANTGELLGAEAVFRGDSYREKASAYALEYIEGQQAYQGVLYPYYQTTLRPESEVFDHFALTEDSVIFYINKYEILPAEYDAIRIEIPRTVFDGCYITDPIQNSVISVKPQETTPMTPEEETQQENQETVTETNGRVIDPTKPMVALTFDDGPSPTATQKILDTLEKYQAVATFYDVGYRVEQYPQVVQREAALGCEVGSHSYDHKDFSKLSAQQIKQDVERTYAAFAVSGVQPTSFRPPYGSLNDTVKQNIPMPIVTWSVDTLDWKSRNANSICNVIAQEGNLDGKVILMHGIYDSTAQAVERMVPQLIEQGYQLVTVSELIQYRHQEQPQNGKLYGYGYFQP